MKLCFIVSTEAEKTLGVGEEWCGVWFLFGIGCCDWVCLGFVNPSLQLLDYKMEQAPVCTADWHRVRSVRSVRWQARKLPICDN